MREVNDDRRALTEVARGLLSEGRVVKVEAAGYSMYPAIKPGSRVHISPVSQPSDLRCGDPVAWFRDDDLVLHRIVHRYRSDERDWFITRGDSALSSDEPVSFEMIAGRIILVEQGRRKYVPKSKPIIPESVYRWNRMMVRVLGVWRSVIGTTSPRSR